MALTSRGCVLAVVAALGMCAVPAAQEPQKTLFERYTDPIEIYKTGLGTFARPISSTNAEAQAFFNQGFQMMWSFAKPEAVRSFREAWKRDPDCAICYWGEAWAWGSYLNAPMSLEESPHAYAAVQKAKSLAAAHATPKERALIDALSVRYVDQFDPNTRVEQDRAYADAMKTLSDTYPDDLDIMTMYGDALFLLEPRRGSRDIKSPNVQRLHRVLETVLAKDVHHPGACHLYVHATESTVSPELAEHCAQFLGSSIPGASHINHMPSHTWNEVGRWGDSVRSNLEAWHSDQKAAIGEGFAIYPEHNLHMLLYAAAYDGQGAISMRAAKDYAKLTNDTSFEVMTLVRFGRFDEVADVKNRPLPAVQGALWDFAQGYGHLKRGEVDFANLYLQRVKKTAETSKAMVRVHTAKNLLGVVAGILEGEIARVGGDLPKAIGLFQAAFDLQESLTYDEPEPLPFHAGHWLGAAQLEAGRPADAEQTYRRELEHHPHNGWSLLGLQQALRTQNRPTADVDADLKASWSRADTWIRSSRF